MKKLFLSVFILICFYSLNAQSWDWAKNINYTCRDRGFSIGSDLKGNIYITGGSDCPTGPSGSGTRGFPFFSKLDNSGNILWTDTTVGGKSVTDVNGNTYAGNVIGEIAKYDSTGLKIWAAPHIDGGGQDIALHPSGGIVVLGRVLIGNDTKSVLSYCDNNGNILWTKTGEFPSGGIAIACDKDGNSYVAGSGYMDSTGNSGFLVKYDSNGALISTKTIPNEPTDVEVSSDLSIYVMGQFSSDPIIINNITYQFNNNTIYLIKYNQQGAVLWSKIIAGSSIDGGAITIDNNCNVYLTGNYKNLNADNFNLNSINGDLFVMKVDSTGNILWIEHSTTTGSPQSGYPNDITVNSANEILITGAINGTHSFGPYTLSQSSMYTDLLVAKIGQGVIPPDSSATNTVTASFTANKMVLL